MIRNGFFCIVCEYDVLFTFYLQMPLILVYIVRMSKAKTLSTVEEINVLLIHELQSIDESILGGYNPTHMHIFELSGMKEINKVKKIKKESKQEERNGKRGISLIIFFVYTRLYNCIYIYIIYILYIVTCINIYVGVFFSSFFSTLIQL